MPGTSRVIIMIAETYASAQVGRPEGKTNASGWSEMVVGWKSKGEGGCCGMERMGRGKVSFKLKGSRSGARIQTARACLREHLNRPCPRAS